jgi:Anti-sigma-K factor rskA, C-terminal
MPDKNDYYEFLYAYTLGCLDENDLINLKNYLESNEDYYWEELGEFQNLSSLLPTVLPLDRPDTEVKDRVARKLYRIRNEIKAKRDKFRKAQKVSDVVVENRIEPEEEKESAKEILSEGKQESIPDGDAEHKVEDFEIVSVKEKISEDLTREVDQKEEPSIQQEKDSKESVLNFDKKPDVSGDDKIAASSGKTETIDSKVEIEKPKDTLEERRLQKQKRIRQIEEKEKAKGRQSLVFMMVFLAMLILLAILGFLYFKFSSSVKGYEARIDSLNQDVANLNEKFSQNKDLQKVLSSRSLKTVNLKETNIAENAFGKLFISLDTNHGFIQVSNLPKLQGNEVYQLWIYIYDNYMILAKFNPAENPAYIPFDTPQLSNDSKVDFMLTEEPGEGSLQPGTKIYLTGSFQ